MHNAAKASSATFYHNVVSSSSMGASRDSSGSLHISMIVKKHFSTAQTDCVLAIVTTIDTTIDTM